MLSRKFKIERKIFPKDLRKGLNFHSPSLSLFVFRGPEKGHSRFSFVVSSKVSNRAVIRNLLRRRGYGVVEKVLLETKPSFLCVFYFKKGSDKTPFGEIEKEIVGLLKKSQVLPR